jgi:hypothetical protein
MSKRRMIRLPSFKGVADGPPGHLIAGTVLQDLAKAISELVDASEGSGRRVPTRKLNPEIKAAETLFRQRAALIHGPVNDNLCKLNAVLLLDAMFAQGEWCRQLARLTDGGAP